MKKKNQSRRTFLRHTAALGATAASAMIPGVGRTAVDKPFADRFEAPDKPFVDQYYDGLIEVVRNIRDTSIDSIAQAMERAYETRRNGGNIYSHFLTGHFAMFAGSDDRPGQPYLLPNRSDRNTAADLENMKRGDFLIANGEYDTMQAARDKGVYVVGITNNYDRFSKTPPGFLSPELTTALEDVSDHVIDSQVPYYNGLVKAPEITNFTICPVSGITQYLVYWACTAVLANLISTRGKGSSTEHAERYLDLALERFQMIGTDRPKIDRVGETWADLVLGKQARLLVYGRPQNVLDRHGIVNLFVYESYVCASGSMIAEPYAMHADTLREGDIVLIGSLESAHPEELKVARHARNAKAYSTAFCPFGVDGDTSGVHTFKEVDAAFNNYSDESEGVFSFKGFDKTVCPLTGVTGNAIHWMLMAAWTDHMARRGEMPCYYQGYHERGGQEYDAMVKPYFDKRGY